MKVLKNQYLERKVCPLFHMKTTDSKNLVKVNQILPIMQEHFGNSNLFQEQRMFCNIQLKQTTNNCCISQ